MTSAPHHELRGVSRGAAAVLVDREDDSLVTRALESLRAVGLDGPVHLLCRAGRRVPTELARQVQVVASDSPAQALTCLAETAERGPSSLVLLDTALVVRPVALLDALDRPGAPTSAWVVDDRAVGAIADADPGSAWPAVRRSTGNRPLIESVSTGYHQVSAPNARAVGLLRVVSADLARAARTWREASTTIHASTALEAHSPEPRPDGTFAMALVSLTRGGLAVAADQLSGWRVGVAPTPEQAAHALAAGAASTDDWRQRLVGARRPVDGLFSTFVLRRISRRITWRLLPTGIAPNAVTILSFFLGIGAALLCLVGAWWALVLAAVVLQISIVLDCVDGEIARYTRRYSALGAWLDVTGDRIKEYGVLAGLAASSTRAGVDLWWLALLALALVAYRHFVDYAFGAGVRSATEPRVAVLGLDRRDDGPEPGAPQAAGRLASAVLATDFASRRPVVHWARKAAHLPIGERYLAISVTLLTGRPAVVLGTLVVLEVLSVLYTTPGRLLRSVAHA